MTVTADIVRLYKQARKIVKARIKQAVSKPNLTAHIGTKTGMASSYYDNPLLAGVRAEMKNNLNAWFYFMIDENMDTFDSIYLLATGLDPNYRLFASGVPAVQNIVTGEEANTFGFESDLKLFGKRETNRLEGLEDGSKNKVNPAENNAGQEKEGGPGTADGGPRNLNTHQFKLLLQKL
ncbi:hypothetical protein DAPPUDRAFT_108184 [Daphnia pulex]|uniref:Uncharacterized protein n=1 Tax=Daphnia pulex TaxID=6669 RepID=E9GZE4_DAPPU|nr:hypothetical protein DAPPUDRAFT_108184 [Daphnia pulex]|eukprot:EFX75135.1 hypothetical protein DAPPUDRAFT_108184 [Daphnia pulex]